MSEQLMTILCPVALEESLLDLLLLNSEVALYTCTRTAVHGRSFGELSGDEQVLGRVSASQIQALLSESAKDKVLSGLHENFPASGVQYWISAVMRSGGVV